MAGGRVGGGWDLDGVVGGVGVAGPVRPAGDGVLVGEGTLVRKVESGRRPSQ